MNGSTLRAACFKKCHAVNTAGWSCALSAILCSLLMAGCAHQQAAPQQGAADISTLVHEVIADPARADKVTALMVQMDEDINAQLKANVEIQHDFKQLNADYQATSGQFEQLWGRFNESRDRARSKILDAYFEIKGITTRQEWEALSKAEMQPLMDFLKKAERPPAK